MSNLLWGVPVVQTTPLSLHVRTICRDMHFHFRRYLLVSEKCENLHSTKISRYTVYNTTRHHRCGA